MFVYGTQYLRGASPAPDQWAKDMAHMKRLGFNTIRVWIVWNALEREEGNIDVSSLSKLLDLAEENGLQVGLLFHLHACPAWAVEKYPQYFYVDENGQAFEPAVRPNTPGGGWPGLCFDHEEVRAMEKRFIEGVIRETRKHKNVAFYEPMNEPHQWIDYTRTPAGFFCFCEASLQKYRLWLEKKYKTIEALNDAWGYFYTDFSQVRPPRWTPSYADYTDFRLFTMDNIADEIAYRTAIIKSLDHKPVIAHAWGGGAVTCAQLGPMAFDDWKNAKIFDKWGYSAFPQNANDCSTLGLGSDASRCAAGGKEYWQSELTAGLVGTGLHQKGRMDDNTFLKLSLESIRHGAHGLLYWQFRKERFGAEFGGFAMTDYAGDDTNLSLCAAKIGKMLNRNADLLLTATQTPAKVALIFSRRSYIAEWISSGRKNNKFAVDSLSGYYRIFWEENIPVDILHDDEAQDLSQYDFIIAPSPYALEEGMADRIKIFIQNGGTFLSDPYFGAFDDKMRLSYQVPGFGFSEVFGCTEDDMRREESIILIGPNGNSMALSGNRHRESFKNVAGNVLLRYEDGTPAVVAKKYGKGTAVLSGVNLGLTYSSRSLISDDITSEDGENLSKDAKSFVLSLCRLPQNPCTAKGVRCSYLSAENADLLFLLNDTADCATGSFSLAGDISDIHEELGTCSSKLQDGFVFVTLQANESCVIRLNHKKQYQ